MIRCENCRHENPPGAVFCSECGAQLVAADLVTQNIRTDQVRQSAGMDAQPAVPGPFDAGGAWGTLHLLEGGQLLPLANRDNFTLGRVSEGQPVMPDIDLSPYNAYASGVSRLHASIRREGKRVVMMDLGSANGTYVNGKRLTPNVERLLNHGDVISLGKLKLQVLLQ